MHRTLFIAAALAALAACGRGGGEAEQGKAAGRAPNQAPADISISTPEGKIEIRSGGAAAAGMPEGIPVYPGAQTAQSAQVSGGGPGGQGRILGFTTADPPARVIAFYGEAAARARFTIGQQMNAGATAMLLADRDGEALSITATRTGDVTQIQIISGLGR